MDWNLVINVLGLAIVVFQLVVIAQVKSVSIILPLLHIINLVLIVILVVDCIVLKRGVVIHFSSCKTQSTLG